VIELWHEWNSVHSFKVRVVLAEKGVQWIDRRVELLKFEHLSPAYLKLNPKGVVPTLVHSGAPVYESTQICHYLEKLCPHPRLARDDAEKWLTAFDSLAHPAIRGISFQLIYRPLLRSLDAAELEKRLAVHPDPKRAHAFRQAVTAPMDESVIEAAIDSFRKLIRDINTSMSGLWLSGNEFGLADVAMAPFAERLNHLGLAALFTDSAKVWMLKVLERKSVQQSQAPPEHRFPGPDPLEVERWIRGAAG
jgi:glutathione S-transferase